MVNMLQSFLHLLGFRIVYWDNRLQIKFLQQQKIKNIMNQRKIFTTFQTQEIERMGNYHARDLTHLRKLVAKSTSNAILHASWKIYACPAAYSHSINHFLHGLSITTQKYQH